MAQINLGIDVDSTSVAPAVTQMDRLKTSINQTQSAMVNAEKSTRGAAAGVGSVGNAAGAGAPKVGAFNRAISDSAASAQRAQAGFNSIKAGIAGIGAIAGGSVVSSLIDTTLQLEKVQKTLTNVTGSTAAAEKEFAYIKETADRLGQSYMGMAGSYSRLLAASKASNISLEDSRNLFEGLTAASSAFGLSQSELEGALTAVQQMISKGKVTAEELTGQLGERLPGALAIAAESMGMTTSQLMKDMEDGAVSVDDFVKSFGGELQERFSETAEGSDGAARSIAEFKNAMDSLKIAVVEGGFLDALKGVVGMMTDMANSQFVKTTGKELQAIGSAIGIASTAMQEFFAQVGRGWENYKANFQSAVAESGQRWNQLKAEIQSAVSTIGAVLTALPQQARDALASLTASFAQIGRDAMDGLIGGFTEKIAGLKAKIAEIASALPQWLQNLWKIRSPSLVFADIGKNAMLGLNEGFTEGQSAVEQNLQRIAQELSSSLSGGLSDLASGNVKGGLGGIIGSITQAIGTPMQESIDELADKIANTVTGLSGPGKLLNSVTMSGVGMGLGNAAVAALEGNKEGIGAGIGQAAGSVLGSFIPGIGTALGGVLGGLAGGFMSKIFGDDVKRDNVTGTVFGGTPYAQQANSRNFSQEDDKTGALSLMQDGLIKLLEEFDRSITLSARGLVASTKDLRAINLQVEDIDKAREMIAGTLSDTIYKKGGQTEELAQEIEARTAAFMQLSTAVAVSGKTAATEAQLAFRQINEDFSDANVEMLRVVGFTGKQIRAAQEEAVGQLSESLNEEMLGTLISLNRATAEELAMWKDMELAALDDRRSAAIKTAREIGASEDLVRSSFKAQRKEVNGEYRDMMNEIIGDTRSGGKIIASEFKSVVDAIKNGSKAAAREMAKSYRDELRQRVAEAEEDAARRGEKRLTKFGTRADLFGSIADDPDASRKDIKRAKEAAIALGKEQFKEQIKAARKAGIGMNQIEKAWQSERKDIAKGFARDNIKVEKDKVRTQDVNNKEWKAAKKQGGKVLHDEIRDLRRRNKEAEQANRDRAKEAREKAKAARQEARDLKAQAIEMTRSLWAVLAGAPGASDKTMQAAKQAEIAAAKASYKQMRKDAKKNGVDLNLVEKAWQAERLGIAQSYAQQMRQTETDRLAMISGLRDTIAGGKNATEDDIRAARKAAIDLAKRGYKDEIREAKKRGVDLALVEKAWQVERKGIMQSYGERLAEVINKPLDKAIEKLTKSLEKHQNRLSRIEEKRSNVLAELTQRTEQMRSAESALRDLRKDLRRSTELAPGGPMERFAEIQKQFQAAIGKAKGGDTDAAQTAAGLAQELLGSGREVYASGSGYADLFKQVNSDLRGVQKSFGNEAKQIEKQLDKESFTEVTERSTTALLRALGTLNGSMKEVKGEIKAQNKVLKNTETKRRIA